MNLSNSQRVIKLLNNFSKNPNLILPYFKHNLSKKFPIDINLPWWSYLSIKYIDTIMKDKVVFEYGTGGSTLRYSKMASEIIAVEDDESWLNFVKAKLEDNKIENVQILLRPFDFKNPEDFDKSGYLNAVNDFDPDIVIIDGQDYSFLERIECFKHVEPRMSDGKYIIFDDFWRYEEVLKYTKAKDVKIFESVGPCRWGVTSTAVFLY